MPTWSDPRAEPGHARDTAAPAPTGARHRARQGFAARLWNEIQDDEVFDRAAALSYYMLFALFPLLLFLTAVLGAMPFTLMDRLMGDLDRVLPSDVVRRTMAEIARGATGGLLSAAILAALWSASSGMSALVSALNVAYDAVEARSWWRRRLVALGLTVALCLFVPATLLLVLFGERAGLTFATRRGLGPTFVAGWETMRWIVIVVMASAAALMVYRLGPAVRLPWRSLVPGSIFAVVAWLSTSLALRYYVGRFADYSATYGSIAGVILLLLWFYLGGVALLVGAEINSDVAGRRWRRRDAGAPPVTIAPSRRA